MGSMAGPANLAAFVPAIVEVPMKCAIALLLLTAAPLVGACGDANVVPRLPTEPTATSASPAPRPDPVISSVWAGKATLIAATGSVCPEIPTNWARIMGVPESRQIRIEQSGTRIELFEEPSYFSMGGPAVYEGELAGREFRTTPWNPGGTGVSRCPGGNVVHTDTLELSGYFSEDGRELTVTQRHVTWSGGRELQATTWSWHASRQ